MSRSSIWAARALAAATGRSSNTTAHAAGMAELELRGLHLAFGGLKVLESVSFAVEAGERILEFVELERYRHQPVGTLGFGTQKIVGFARALALEPKVLLLDEPSAGLNREEREDLARHILRIKHELDIAMVWVEHDMQMVADLADRLYVLNYGVPLATGAPDAVLKDPRVIEAYLGGARA